MFPFRINFTLFCVSQYFRVLFFFFRTIPCMHNYTVPIIDDTWYIITVHIIFYLVLLLQFLFCCTNLTMQKCIEKNNARSRICMNWRGLYFYTINSLHVQPQSCTMRSCSQSSGSCSCSVQFLRSVKNTYLSDSAARPNSLFSVLRVRYIFRRKKKELRCSQRPWNSCTTDPCRIRSEADVEAETRASTDARVPAILCIMNVTSILSLR